METRENISIINIVIKSMKNNYLKYENNSKFLHVVKTKFSIKINKVISDLQSSHTESRHEPAQYLDDHLGTVVAVSNVSFVWQTEQSKFLSSIWSYIYKRQCESF